MWMLICNRSPAVGTKRWLSAKCLRSWGLPAGGKNEFSKTRRKSRPGYGKQPGHGGSGGTTFCRGRGGRGGELSQPSGGRRRGGGENSVLRQQIAGHSSGPGPGERNPTASAG